MWKCCVIGTTSFVFYKTYTTILLLVSKSYYYRFYQSTTISVALMREIFVYVYERKQAKSVAHTEKCLWVMLQFFLVINLYIINYNKKKINMHFSDGWNPLILIYSHISFYALSSKICNNFNISINYFIYLFIIFWLICETLMVKIWGLFHLGAFLSNGSWASLALDGVSWDTRLF